MGKKMVGRLSRRLAVLAAAVLLTACGPSNSDISQAMTTYTKAQFNKTLAAASALGGSDARKFATQLLGIPDPKTLPDFTCTQSHLQKQSDDSYQGVVQCSNPALNRGKPAYGKVTLYEFKGTWAVTDYHAVN
ncbi:MAG TPA: hypothetical protein VFQ88_15405 [Nevskiaceae bacterium]|nr:hypothetical protein [Nevskiaceae bacterium]